MDEYETYQLSLAYIGEPIFVDVIRTDSDEYMILAHIVNARDVFRVNVEVKVEQFVPYLVELLDNLAKGAA